MNQATASNSYKRFTVTQRIEHLVLLLSFTVLAVTGLPQKYSGAEWAQTAIALMGGIEFVRFIHRVAAIVLMLETIFHIVRAGYLLFVRRAKPTMLPTFKDVTDALGAFLYNIGLRKESPPTGRYTYSEKAEYWAVVWGTAVMVITGFMMWNPIATARLLPGQTIPAAKAAHGGEALLAVLSIIVWHMYHVHIRHFNQSMFTGTLSEHEMLAEHPLELAALKAGIAESPPDPSRTQKRGHIYYPAAALLAAGLLFGVYFFVTFENTAISTIERREVVDAFLPLTATPLPTPRPTATPIPLLPVWAGNLALVFDVQCVDCHGGISGLDFSTYEATMKGGISGAIIVPGDPDNSILVQKMSKKHPGKLGEFELMILRQWIVAGAPEK